MAGPELGQNIFETGADIAPLFSVYPHTVVVRELVGYSADLTGAQQPLFGNRLALYHPVRSELTQLNEDGWKAFDAFSQGPSRSGDVATSIGLDTQNVQSIAVELKDRWILLPDSQKMKVTVQANFTDEAEMYMETTEACNFGCPGCATGADRYESGQAKTLTPETLEMLLDRSAHDIAEKGIKKLRVKWAGGEALMPLSRKLIGEGQRVINRLKEEIPELEITQVILTNGSHLSEEVVSQLKEWDIHVAVSLWGIGEANDIARGVRREKDKFPHIAEGIKRLHDAGVTYNLHHVVTPDNAAQFADFVRAVWDPKSDTFIGRDWEWPNGKKQPIPLGLAFFRPQTPEQLTALNKDGYKKMIDGLRKGFEVMRELIKDGVSIHPLDKIDYLQLFGVIPTPCGTGFNYFAAGPRGVASCHEALFSMAGNMEAIRENQLNVLDLANSEYAGQQANLIGANLEFTNVDATIRTILQLHGGSGCPRTTKVEHDGHLGYAASTAEALYAPIIQELLSLETLRRLTSMPQAMDNRSEGQNRLERDLSGISFVPFSMFRTPNSNIFGNLSLEDTSAKFQEWFSNPATTQYLSHTPPDTKEWILDLANDQNASYFFIFAGDQLIGHAGLREIDWESHSAVAGIMIGPEEFRGKGYGSMAVKKLLQQKPIGVTVIKADIDEANIPSRKAFESNGFNALNEKASAGQTITYIASQLLSGVPIADEMHSSVN